MKKVLMIAHQFPPIGGSGVQRTAKFVKYLPTFGWEGVVLTRRANQVQLADETLTRDIPEGTRVYRSPAWDLSELFFPLNLLGKFIRRKMLIPDGERLWQLFSKKEAMRIVEKEGIALIYSTSQPFSTHLLALEIKKMYPHLPWVADFRDEWTNNAFVKAYGYGMSRIQKERKMELDVFDTADAVVINTPFMRDNSAKDYPQWKHKFHVIPNGFDREDFEGLQETRLNEKFTITYTGLIYGNTSPLTVFKAVAKLIGKNQIQLQEICLRFIGRFKTEELIKQAKNYGLSDVTEFLPYKPHRESIQSLMQSDMVLLLLGEGTEAIYTGKLMEYINTGKPILASIPAHGAAAALIEDTGTGYVADTKDVDTTALHLLNVFTKWKKGEILFSPNLEKISQYERRELTKKLAEIFEQLC